MGPGIRSALVDIYLGLCCVERIGVLSWPLVAHLKARNSSIARRARTMEEGGETVGMEKAGGRACLLSLARTMDDHRVLHVGLRFE